MDSQNINPTTFNVRNLSNITKKNRTNEKSFKSLLEAGDTLPPEYKQGLVPINDASFSGIPLDTALNTVSKTEALVAYQKSEKLSNQENMFTPNSSLNSGASGGSDWEKYKDDQLLSNPGGDHYYLDRKVTIIWPHDQEFFGGRIKKDISDAFSNAKNFFRNLFSSSKRLYRDQDCQIEEASQRGLVRSAIDLFEDIGSALTFGAWRPDGEEKPLGFSERAGFFFAKMKDAVFNDLVQGVAGSAVRMGEDLTLACWNLLEVVPDASIGNFEFGKKLTTTIFDNGQVAIDYLTDVVPAGEAWFRVHAMDLRDFRSLEFPVLYNIKMPEHYTEDARWAYVRNTPFRKTIETIGALLGNFLTYKLSTDPKRSEEEDHKERK